MGNELLVPPTSATQQIDTRSLTRHQKSLIGIAITGNIAEFFDMFLIGFVVSLLVKPWNLSGFEAGVILACSGLGTVAGAVVWGRLADKIGRRDAFFWCVLLFVFFTFLSVFTPDRGWWMLAILRIGVGLGVGGLNISSIPYVQEFVPAKQRGLLAGLASVFIPIGLLLGAQAQQWLGTPLGWRGLIALGVIPMALNVEFDFIRREITIGGIGGQWFIHLSAALVSGLFVSTALTLIMVPVMITAPNVIWGQLKSIGGFFAGIGRAVASPFRRRGKQVPVATTPMVPEGVDSAARYMSKDGSGLVAREQDGVTVVTRQAAE